MLVCFNRSITSSGGFLNNVLYADKPSMWASEALSFLATGVAAHGVAGPDFDNKVARLEHLTSAYNNIPELKNKKVVITQDVFKKIIDIPNKFNKNHNIERKRALKLPQLIADPLYILQSTSKGNEHRFVIVTSSRGNLPSQKLSIILNPKNAVAVVSAYDEKIDISEEKKNSRVLYDKKKELSKTLSASKAVTIDNSNTIITDNANNFNPNKVFTNQHITELK